MEDLKVRVATIDEIKDRDLIHIDHLARLPGLAGLAAAINQGAMPIQELRWGTRSEWVEIPRIKYCLLRLRSV